MMRLIDADIYVTANLYDDEHEEYRGERMTIADCLDRFTDEGCPTGGKTKQEWIPCSERLPIIQDEETHTFIVTYYDNDSPNQLLVGMMIFHDGIWYKPECDEVIAWMQLPKPYKEDK